MKVKVWCDICEGVPVRTRICFHCAGAGYILQDLYELDLNQDLPENPYIEEWNRDDLDENVTAKIYHEAQMDMRKERFRRVKGLK